MKERASSTFAAFAPDMKLEQSINRFSQGPGCHAVVGRSGDAAYITEINLLFHEISVITNLLHQVTNAHLMDHLETAIQHELRGRKGQIFDKNVFRLLDFINTRHNPFIIDGPKAALHNIVAKQTDATNVKDRILSVLVDGQKIYQQYRQERYVQKVKNISDTISKKNLPAFDHTASNKTMTVKQTVLTKDISSAQQGMEIAMMRFVPLEEIFAYDHLPCSALFEGKLHKKTQKAQLMTSLEAHLDNQPVFSPNFGNFLLVMSHKAS